MEEQEQVGGNGENPNGENPRNHDIHDASVVHYRMNNAGGGDDAEFDDNFPPGYRFLPNDKELLFHYLQRKVLNVPLPPNRIEEVQLYKYNPETLAAMYKPLGLTEWYFFTPRDRKYKNGKRPSRAAGDGFWKATGTKTPILNDDAILGHKRSLVFHMGKPSNGEKTHWLMHEFRLKCPPRIRSSKDDMRLDDWVICRIYNRRDQNSSRTGLVSSRPSSSQRDDSGSDDKQPDTEFRGKGAIDRGIEDSSSLLPKGSFIPQVLGGSRVIDMPGSSNQGGFFNSNNNNFLDLQNRFGNNQNVPYSECRIPGFPNPNVPYAARLNPGMPAMLNPGIIPYHNVSHTLSFGRPCPRMPINNVSGSQGIIHGMPNHNFSDSQGRLPGFAPYSYNNPRFHPNTNNVAGSSSATAARPFLLAYHHQYMFDTANQNLNQVVASSSSSAARSFQAYAYPQQHHDIFTTCNHNPNQVAQSSAAAAAIIPFQSTESNVELEVSNEYQPTEDSNFLSDDNNSWKF